MTLRLSALFEDRVQALLSLSDTRKTRKQRLKDKNSPCSVARNGLDENNRKYSVSNSAANSGNTLDSSLRLVLRRNGDRADSVGGSVNVSGSSSSSVADSTSRSVRALPRRTGIAINLHTGRARELSDESNSPVDIEKATARSASSTNGESVVRNVRKKVKRVTMPRDFLSLRTRSGESRTDKGVVDSAVKCKGENRANGTVEAEGKLGYSTRSGRRVRPKRFPMETDSEKENKGREENGAEYCRKRKRQHSTVYTGEGTGLFLFFLIIKLI